MRFMYRLGVPFVFVNVVYDINFMNANYVFYIYFNPIVVCD